MAKDEGRPKQRRNRAKGLKWLAGVLINPDRPLGSAWPDRPWRDIPVVLLRRDRGGEQVYEDVACFVWALELNARAVYAYADTARDDALPPEVEQALAQLPELSDDRHREAVDRMTGFGSVAAHKAAVADTVAQAVRGRRHVAALAQLLRVRRALDQGRCDAALMHERCARFVRDSIDNNRRPSETVLLRTFLPFALADRAMASVRQIQAALFLRRALRRSSDVAVGDLALMAFHAGVNPSVVYFDYDYLGDLLALAVHAGARARGDLRPPSALDAATYRCMLCEGGEDPETNPHLRRERADLAAALRRVWVQVPGLAAATRQHGTLAAPV